MKTKPIPRHHLITLAQTALSVGEHRYARRITLAWLAIYPGDLPVLLLHARALQKDNLPGQSLVDLNKICQIDPEYLPAQQLLAEIQTDHGMKAAIDSVGSVFALGGKPISTIQMPEWAPTLRKIRNLLADNQIDAADRLLHQILHIDPPQPLIHITHLRILRSQDPPTPPQAIHNIADSAHQHWPNCLVFQLSKADVLMDNGNSEEAVNLLHQVAVADVTGQVADRWWGENHPYRSLWPEYLEVGTYGPSALHDIQIPGAVATALGQNQLSDGIQPNIFQASPIPLVQQPRRINDIKRDSVKKQPSQKDFPNNDTPPAEISADDQTAIVHMKILVNHKPAMPYKLPKSLRPLQIELEKIANQIKKPELARADGRFPAYGILTTRRGLEVQYGNEGMQTIAQALQRLCTTIGTRPDMDALLIFADDPQSTSQYQLGAVAHNDAWGIKRMIADLDAYLGQRGERIAALLIAGGPRIVPFHHLPNPVEDADLDVPSDNPYACRDENYFIPEWPVGRLPGDNSADYQPLLHSIEAMIRRHQKPLPKRKPWWQRFIQFLKRILGQEIKRISLGYSAAAWRRSSVAVYRTIGEPRSLLVSPPLQAESSLLTSPSQLAYFNLHGIADSALWYGQRDPCEPGTDDQPDFPIALRPDDVQNSGRAPQIIFSEACFGAHIIDKAVDQALALKFLTSGSQAVIGSTCTSYGSVTMPLIAADLLGRSFWAYLQEGFHAGEALRRAKIALVREMIARQGYLDGEDQKTLISFILYGDPLAQAGLNSLHQQTELREERPPVTIHTINDSNTTQAHTRPIPPTVMAQVKHVVAHYLPGMSDADARLSRERLASPAGAKSHTSGHQVITLRKSLDQESLQHWQYARLTLDRSGKLVKLAVSR